MHRTTAYQIVVGGKMVP